MKRSTQRKTVKQALKQDTVNILSGKSFLLSIKTYSYLYAVIAFVIVGRLFPDTTNYTLNKITDILAYIASGKDRRAPPLPRSHSTNEKLSEVIASTFLSYMASTPLTNHSALVLLVARMAYTVSPLLLTGGITAYAATGVFATAWNTYISTAVASAVM